MALLLGKTFANVTEVVQHLVEDVRKIKKQLKKVKKENSILLSELSVSVSTQAAIQADIGQNSLSQLVDTSLWHSIAVCFKRQNHLAEKAKLDMEAELSQLSQDMKASVGATE